MVENENDEPSGLYFNGEQMVRGDRYFSPIYGRMASAWLDPPTTLVKDSLIEDPFPKSGLRGLLSKLLFWRERKYPIIVYRKISVDACWSILPKICWQCKTRPCLCHHFEKTLKDPSLCWECQLESCLCQFFEEEEDDCGNCAHKGNEIVCDWCSPDDRRFSPKTEEEECLKE